MRSNLTFIQSRKSFILFLFAGLLCLFNSVTMAQSGKSGKKNITRSYKVHAFSEIDISTVGDVYYTQSANDKSSVTIYGPEIFINQVKVEGKGNTLVLSSEKNLKSKNGKLKITISSPQLNRIDFKGVGNLTVDKPLNTPRLAIVSKGVGNVEIKQLTCDELTLNSIGVGDIYVEGTAKRAILHAKGVGNIEAKALKAEAVEASSKGVGNITCYATQTITASAKGVGGIRYKGNPTQKNLTKSGAASIKTL